MLKERFICVLIVVSKFITEIHFSATKTIVTHQRTVRFFRVKKDSMTQGLNYYCIIWKMCRSRSDTAHFAHDELERNLFNVAHAFQCYSFFFFWRHFAGQLCLSSSTSNKNSWLTIYVELMKQDNQELLRNLLLIYITTCLTYSSLIKCKKSNWNYANVVISFSSF